MPVTILHFFRYAFRAFFVALIFFGITLFSPSAYADPHAVFYTDRAQEQLFYNTLAALNQADFVEPGRANNTPYTREFLAARRAAVIPFVSPNVPFVQETNPLLTSTHTDLPGVVSRSITLEGNDLWTAYLVSQLAVETSQRRSESKLSRILCQAAFGNPGCSQDAGSDQLEENAFVTTPVNQDGEVQIAKDAILASGSAEEKLIHQMIQKARPADITANPALFKIPRPNSPILSSLRETITLSNNTEALDFLDSVASSAGSSNQGLDPGMFNGVTFDERGVPKIDEEASADEYIGKLRSLANLPSALSAIGNAGAEQQRQFQYYKQNPTVVADSVLRSTSADGGGAIYGRITTPANQKAANAGAILNVGALAAATQKAANPATIQTPGKTSIVDPRASQDSLGTAGILDLPPVDPNLALQNNNPNDPQIAGISTGFDAQQLNLYQQTYNRQSTSLLSPAVNSRDPLEEPGILQALDRATNRSSNAFDYSPGASQSSFDLSISQIIKSSIVGDILCSIFPTIPSCLASRS